MEVGRVCVKLAGREAGKKCVVVDVIDKNYVLVSGPEVKRRRCNIGHLEPLEQKLEVKKDASDEDIKQALGGEKAKPGVKHEEPREEKLLEKEEEAEKPKEEKPKEEKKPPEKEEKPEEKAEKPKEEKLPEEKPEEKPPEEKPTKKEEKPKERPQEKSKEEPAGKAEEKAGTEG